MSFSQKSETGYLSFAKGLATEVNPLSVPEELKGTTSDELNMTVDTDGLVRVRRAGLGLLGVPRQAVPGRVLEVKYWRTGECYVVCSYDNILVDGQFTCTTTFIHTTDASKDRAYTTKVLGDDFLINPQVVFLRTKCMVTYGGRPLLFTREASGEFTIHYVDVFVRDFKLVDDLLNVSERPGSPLSSEHKYNLLNAGWYQDRMLLSTGAVGDPIANFYTVRVKYPSNADVAALGDITDTGGDIKFDPNAYDNINLGSTEAARGHYVYNIRSIDRDVKATNLVQQLKDGAPSSTLSLLLLEGNDPITSLPPAGDIDDDFPEPPIPPGGVIP